MRLSSTLNLVASVVLLGIPALSQTQGTGSAKPPLYNTAKQKLLEGKQVFSFTQIDVRYRRLLRSGQTLRLHLVRNAAQHARIQGRRGDDRRLPARRRDPHDPAAGRAGMAHPARHRYRRAGRDHPDRGRCGAGARSRQVGALSAGGAPQRRRRPGRAHLGHQRHQLPPDLQRQHAGGGHDRNAHRRRQRLRHRVACRAWMW